MKYLVLALLSVSMIACGDDDTKKAATNNVTANNENNTATNNENNTATNNTATNNTATNNTATNNANNVQVGALDLGEDTAAISTLAATDICTKGEAYYAANITEAQVDAFGCFISGYFGAAYSDPAPTTDAELQAACTMGYEACLAEEPTPENNAMDTCDFVTTGCEAEIRLLEACLEGQTAMFKAASAITCDDVTLETDPLSELGEQPLECDQLEMECPNLFPAEG